MEEKHNEIDLIQISRNMMVRTYHYILRRYKLLGIFIIVGAIAGIVSSIKNKNKYENTIIGTSYFVNPTIIVEIINSLQEINHSDKDAIVKFLKIDKESAMALIKIHADTISSFKTFEGQKLTTIKITVNFNKDLDFSEFASQLSNFIDSNIFVASELRLEKKRIMELVIKYDEEIKKLDSLQRKILASKMETAGNGGLLILNDKANSFFHNDIINLEVQKQSEIKKMERLTGLTIIDEKKGTKTKNNPFIETIAKMIALFFGIGFLISIVIEFKRQVIFIENHT